MDAVKLEGGARMAETIRFLTMRGIPVMAHIGLTPQSVHQMGGFKVQRDEDRLLQDAKDVQAAGAFSVVLEGIPSPIAKKITEILAIPTIGIGAGADCDGQVLVLYDILGITAQQHPRFVKDFLAGAGSVDAAVRAYVAAVKDGSYPAAEHLY